MQKSNARILFSLFVVFIIFINPDSLFSQWLILGGDKLIQLEKSIVESDTCKICALLEKALQFRRIYFFEWLNKEYDVEFAIITSDGKIYERNTIDANGENFVFEIPFGYIKIDSVKIKLKNITTTYSFDDIWQPSMLIKVKLMLDKNDQLVYKTDMFACPVKKGAGILDKPIISLPIIRPKMSLLTTSFGIITFSSFIWFLNEKSNVDDSYNRYQNSYSMIEAVDNRIQTFQSRTRRDHAGALTITSGAIFSILLVRDLFFRNNRQEAVPIFGLINDTMSKSQYSLKPVIFEDELCISLCIEL